MNPFSRRKSKQKEAKTSKDTQQPTSNEPTNEVGAKASTGPITNESTSYQIFEVADSDSELSELLNDGSDDHVSSLRNPKLKKAPPRRLKDHRFLENPELFNNPASRLFDSGDADFSGGDSEIKFNTITEQAQTPSANDSRSEFVEKMMSKHQPSLEVSDETIDSFLDTKIEEALKKESLAPYKRTKLMVIGQGRVGKTSTIRSLMKQTFDPNEKSTKGAGITRVDASNWEENNKSYLVEHLERLLTEKDGKSPAEAQPSKYKSTIHLPKEEVSRYGKDIVLGKSDDNLAFSIWDFGGQKVFYSLHHLFLTEFGCYLLVFDVTSMIDDQRRKEAIEFLHFWLFSKKLHAPLAPIILVGTHADDISQKDLKHANDIISQQVLGSHSFGEVHFNSMCFIDVENNNRRNIDLLRDTIEKVVRQQKYIKQLVPVSFLRVLELLLDTNKQYISLIEAHDIMKSCGLNYDLFDESLSFLSQRGLITYFSEHETLRRYIILQPQWLISAITDILFDKDEHLLPEFDSRFGRDFRKFTNERVLSLGLLTDIWAKKGFSGEVQKFLRRIMLKSSLMCNYSFEGGENYLVPALFEGRLALSEEPKEDDEYCGPFAVIDFSGNYEMNLRNEDEQMYVKYLPFGFFERLVCLCIDMSSLYSNSMKPTIEAQFARMSFGVDIDFELRVCNDDDGKPLWIKIKTDEDTTMNNIRDLIKKQYSMVEGLRDDFFGKKQGSSKLAISLLVPSSEETGNILAEYKMLFREYKSEQESLKDGTSNKSKKLRPNRTKRNKISLSAFSHWFESNSESPLIGPELSKSHRNSNSLSNLNMKPLPNGLKYHCFLSYKQSSAIDIVGKQFYILTGRGYKCWYDQQFKGDINLTAMQEGVRDSMCYMLFLSKDIFPSPYVEAEVAMAISLKKPIILVHHPDTGSVGYWQFGDYISKSPEILKPFFAKIESIQLQRRHYLEEAVTHVLTERLSSMYSDSMRKSNQ